MPHTVLSTGRLTNNLVYWIEQRYDDVIINIYDNNSVYMTYYLNDMETAKHWVQKHYQKASSTISD